MTIYFSGTNVHMTRYASLPYHNKLVHFFPTAIISKLTTTMASPQAVIPLIADLMSECSVKGLIAFAQTSADAAQWAAAEMRIRVLKSLSSVFEHPTEVLRALNSYNSVLSGKFVLSLLDPLGQVGFESVDILAGNEAFALMVHFLEQQEHATMDQRLTTVADFKPGSYKYALLLRCPKTTVRLIRATTPSPYTLIPHYSATHLMNFITSTYLLVAYPASTFARRGLQLVDTLPPSLATTYTVTSRHTLIQNGLGCRHVLCGARWRVFNDTLSAWIRLEERADDVDVEESTQWQLGAGLAANAALVTYVVAAGAVATPQILANSGFGAGRNQTRALIPALGKGITEQPLAFCQIILNQKIVEHIGDLSDKPEWWKYKVNAHKFAHEDDPLPIPFQDPEPQVNIPVTKEFPWHAQIHRDAFSYGEAGPRADSRVVVDLRFFARQAYDPKNRIIFEEGITDVYGMPQATFEYTPTAKYADEAGRMMKDMTDVANALGGYLPGSSPQFMAPGLALHLGGTVRLGQGKELLQQTDNLKQKDKAESVADFNSQVWDFRNLYVAGNGTIPTPFAANPTLTSIALALRATRNIVKALHADPTGKNLKAPVPSEKLEPTPKEYLKWLTDKHDADFPNHKDLHTPHKEVIYNSAT